MFCGKIQKNPPKSIILILLLSSGWIFGSDDEYRLLQDLRENYDPIERPVQNHSEPIDVHLRLILQQLVDVTWYDYKMRWSPEEYGGIQDIRFPPDALWKPDILLFNRFPFDEQLCFLKYGAWTYTGSKLRLFIDDKDTTRGNKMDLQYYVTNGEWELLATPAFVNITVFGEEPYMEAMFYLHVRRKTIYYGMNWIIPSILFLLSNVLGFTMPAECGEKITLQITNLLSVTVFLGMVADVTPPTSTSVPIIGLYEYIYTKFVGVFFSISMLILGSSIIFTLLIVNVHFRSPRTHKMSPWVRTVFLEWLPWLLLMNRPGKQFKKPKKNSQRNRSRTESNTSVHRRALSGPLDTPTSGGGRSAYAISLSRQLNRYNSELSNESPGLYHKTIGTGDIQSNKRKLLTKRQFSMDPENQKLLNYSLPIQQHQTSITPSTSSAFTPTTAYFRQNQEQKLKPQEFNAIDRTTLILLRNTLHELSDHLRLSQQKMDEEEEEEEAKADWRFMAMALDRACLFFYALMSCVIPIWVFMSTPSSTVPPDPIEHVNETVTLMVDSITRK